MQDAWLDHNISFSFYETGLSGPYCSGLSNSNKHDDHACDVARQMFPWDRLNLINQTLDSSE